MLRYRAPANSLGDVDCRPLTDRKGTSCELAKGNSHSRNDSHYVVAGGAGHFRMGRSLKFNYEDTVRHNNL